MNNIFQQYQNIKPALNWKRLHIDHKEFYNLLMLHTSFMDESYSILQRLWIIENGLSNFPKCKVCSSDCNKWDRDEKQFRLYCSVKCSNSDPDKIQKTKNVFIEKFGVDNPSKNNGIKIKRKKTNLTKYGSTTPMGNPDIVKKSQTTNLKKYGHTSASKDEDVKRKIGDANRKFDQKISSEELTFLMENKSLGEICQIFNITYSQLDEYLKYYSIEKIYHNRVEETEIFRFISKFYEENNMIRNTRKVISPFELDIFFPAERIAIEYCGLYWHSSQYKDSAYHFNKFKLCDDLNIKLITIFQDEWRYNKEFVKILIKSYLIDPVKLDGNIKFIKQNIDDIFNIPFSSSHIVPNKNNIIVIKNDNITLGYILYEQESIGNTLNVIDLVSFINLQQFIDIIERNIHNSLTNKNIFFNLDNRFISHTLFKKHEIIKTIDPISWYVSRDLRCLDNPTKDLFKIFDCGRTVLCKC